MFVGFIQYHLYSGSYFFTELSVGQDVCDAIII